MKINNYIKKLKKKNKNIYNSEKNDIDIILNNINNSVCYKLFTNITQYSISGESNILKIFDYTYLIPNLFRKCYFKNTLAIPDICVNYVKGIDTKKYLPYLLDEIYIKGFLYFNFPVNIKYYSSYKQYINNIVNIKYYLRTKSYNTTYGSFTTGNVMYNSIYSPISMLSQLLDFNYSLGYDYQYSNNQKINCAYEIKWDYTTGCALANNYVVSAFNSNNILSQQTMSLLNRIRDTFFNEFINKDINYNDILLVYKSNIYIIIQYALEVYTDIVNELDYYIRDAQYCKKDYMNIKNIPILVKLYETFYKNQVESYKKALPISKAANITPVYININTYTTNFINYFVENNLGQILNVIYLDNQESIVLCYIGTGNPDPATINRTMYKYYYINIFSPSAVELSNYWGETTVVPTYTGSPLSDFVNDFLYNGVPSSDIPSFISTTKAQSVVLNSTIPDGGLYPLPNITIEAQTYYLYNNTTNTSLNSKVFLTFETEYNNAIGLPLVYYYT